MMDPVVSGRLLLLSICWMFDVRVVLKNATVRNSATDPRCRRNGRKEKMESAAMMRSD